MQSAFGATLFEFKEDIVDEEVSLRVHVAESGRDEDANCFPGSHKRHWLFVAGTVNGLLVSITTCPVLIGDDVLNQSDR